MLLFVFIAIQFIRPKRNSSKSIQEADLVTNFDVPQDVAILLRSSCYDCHSNNTRYPWYADVQPFGWILSDHIEDGKAELNFNEFTNYSQRRKVSKLKAIQNSIKDGSMPLRSYTALHRDAKLSGEKKTLLINWTTKIIDSLSMIR